MLDSPSILTTTDCSGHIENASRFPSSQTHEAAETDLHVTAIESVLAKLSEAERAAIIKHIIKLANMSRKQRAAIMALTDGD
ncbi:MAG: hypothetical protein CMJ20_11890 [Phycisphaeraceae bacterium]|nr:hypothetical protein [Phycisphaeraceae bacterium]|tara:strand:+ start:2018 stop:2263 length:246 start_codon:yes stop_codon:yes gene_type:complete